MDIEDYAPCRVHATRGGVEKALSQRAAPLSCVFAALAALPNTTAHLRKCSAESSANK